MPLQLRLVFLAHISKFYSHTDDEVLPVYNGC